MKQTGFRQNGIKCLSCSQEKRQQCQQIQFGLVLILIVVAAFTYQILVLSLLDRVGREEKRANLKEMIKQTYLIAAAATIVSIVGLRCFARSYLSYGIVTAVCCLIAFSAVRKNPIYAP